MIEYFTLPELPDRPMFRCERKAATLQVSNCKAMWLEANGKNPPERLISCRACPIGAAHAGVEQQSESPLCGSDICQRCTRGGMRLVRDEICVSCWNREREYLLGKNAKGVAPARHPPVYAAKLRVMVGEAVTDWVVNLCCSTEEAIVSALKANRKQVLFSFGNQFAEAALAQVDNMRNSRRDGHA